MFSLWRHSILFKRLALVYFVLLDIKTHSEWELVNKRAFHCLLSICLAYFYFITMNFFQESILFYFLLADLSFFFFLSQAENFLLCDQSRVTENYILGHCYTLHIQQRARTKCDTRRYLLIWKFHELFSLPSYVL